jgi:prophage antirepressor-like protein
MKTTAAQLLDLVFEGYHVTSHFHNGAWMFATKETAAACQISKAYDVIKNHIDPDQLTSISVEVRSANGTIQKRMVQFTTQSGVFALVMGSRKPAARRFQRWLADEVLPQLIQYGSYLPDTSRAERLQALHRRWRQERAACLESSAATMAESGLMTLKAFREEHSIPARDVLSIARRLTRLAKADGIAPTKLTLKGHANPANTWPRPLLAAAVNSTIPKLPL